LFMEHLKSAAGGKVVERFETVDFDTFADPRWSRVSVQQRRERRNLRPTWWAIPARNRLTSQLQFSQDDVRTAAGNGARLLGGVLDDGAGHDRTARRGTAPRLCARAQSGEG